MAEAIVPSLRSLLTTVRSQYTRSSKYGEQLDKLKLTIEQIDQFLKEANSMETIQKSKHKCDMQQARKFLYDSEDAIDDLMRHESNDMLEGLLPDLYRLFSRIKFVSQAEDIRERLKDYVATREEIGALVGKSSADWAATISAHRSSSTAMSSTALSISAEEDCQLEGIDGARKQLVEWLINDDSMSKVIFVHGAQGVGKTSLVGTVFRHPQVKRCFKYCVWFLRYDKLMDSYVVILDLTTKDSRQDTLTAAFQFMKNDEELSEKRKRWAIVLDDARKAHVIKSLQGHLDPTGPSVLITTRDSSLESFAKELASASRTSTDTPGEPSGGAPPKKHGDLSSMSNAFISLASRPKACLNSQQAQSNDEAPNGLNGFRNFKHVSLSTDHSFELFRRKIFNNGPYPDDLQKDCKSILNACEGLPLAILATCDFLKQHPGPDNGTPQNVVWGNLKGRLGEKLLSKGDLSPEIQRMITLHMDELHDVHTFLFYLSIFPLDCPIRRSTLMRLWVAERFAMEEGSRTDQAIAEENLKKLLDHNFIWEVERTSYGRVRTCRIHNLQHEIIAKISQDDEFAVIVADQEKKLPETIWRLSLHSQMNPIKDGRIFHSQINCIKDRIKRLRSLLVFKTVYRKSMEELLGLTDRLKVLHLEASSMYSFITRIPSLKYLRYLKLSDPRVVAISKDIEYLLCLETLDLKGTGVRELPDGILKLKKLRHLLVYISYRSPDAVDPKVGVKVPSALGDLNSLQKLCMIELNPVKPRRLLGRHWKREQLLEALGKLTSLKRLGISNLMSKDGELLCSSIEKLTELEALHLIATPEEIIDLSALEEINDLPEMKNAEINDLSAPEEINDISEMKNAEINNLSAPEEINDLSEMKSKRKAPARLQRVHLTGCFGKLPYWLLSSKSLVKLVLKRSRLNGDPLQHLGKLRNLQHLELQQAFDVHEMTFKAGWFPQLRFLGVNTIDSLHTIIVDEEALPTLEILSLARCPSLTKVPQDITRPGKLSCLKLLDMPGEFERSVEKNAAVHTKMTVQVERWIIGSVQVVMTLPNRPAGSLSDPRRLEK